MNAYLICGYVFMWVVTSIYVYEGGGLKDVIASMIAAVAWPVLLTVAFLKRYLG